MVSMLFLVKDDCLKRIPNRFQMTLAATYRARQIANGATPMVEANRDKLSDPDKIFPGQVLRIPADDGRTD